MPPSTQERGADVTKQVHALLTSLDQSIIIVLAKTPSLRLTQFLMKMTMVEKSLVHLLDEDH